MGKFMLWNTKVMEYETKEKNEEGTIMDECPCGYR